MVRLCSVGAWSNSGCSVSTHSDEKRRSETLAGWQKKAGDKAKTQRDADAKAVQVKIARLRALRLAKEAADLQRDTETTLTPSETAG